MENNNIGCNCSLGLLSTILGIIFIVLKLCNIITWSWIWVLAPFWIGYSCCLIIYLCGLIIAILLAIIYALTEL